MKRVACIALALASMGAQAEVIATVPITHTSHKGVETDGVLFLTDEIDNDDDYKCSTGGARRAYVRLIGGETMFSCWKFYNGMVLNYTTPPGFVRQTLFTYFNVLHREKFNALK